MPSHWKVQESWLIMAPFGSPYAFSFAFCTYSGSAGVNQRRAAAGLHVLGIVHNFLVGDSGAGGEPVLPSVNLHTIILLSGGHAVVRPVDNNGLQVRQLVANAKDLLRLLSSLADANLALRVVQHVVAGIRSVRCINTNGNSTDKPASIEREEVLRGIKANNTAAAALLQANRFSSL